MAKKQLKLDNAFDFALIGLLCQHKDYRLCNAVNKALGVDMVRIEDLELQNNKADEHATFALFQHDEEEEGRQYFILANRDNNNRNLVPEQSKMDYFVLLKGGFNKEETETIRLQLKSIPIVLGA